MLVSDIFSYFVPTNIQKMDRQCSSSCMSILVNGSLHYIKHWNHMIQGKDPYTFHWHMQGLRGIRNWACILVCSSAVYRYNFVRKNTLVDYFYRDIGRMVRKEMECKDFLVLLVSGSLLIKIYFLNNLNKNFIRILFILLSSTKHLTKGSPTNCGGQLHIGLWLITWHFALIPHVPGQGSIHFWLLHALSCVQSELITHSGRHAGGLPI